MRLDEWVRAGIARAAQITQDDAQPVLELLSAGFEITWFKEIKARLWVALAKPLKEIEDHFGIHFECFVIGHGFPQDFHQRTLLQQPPREIAYRVDPSLRFIASSAPQANAACAAWAAANRTRVVLIKPDLTGQEAEPQKRLYSLLSTSLWRRDLFAESEPVRLASEFFGREVLVNEVTARVLAGQPFGVFGLRKIGKSSLLARATDLLIEDSQFLVVPAFVIGNASKIRAGRWWEVFKELFSGWQQKLEEFAEINKLPVRPKIGKLNETLSRGKFDEASLATSVDKDIISLLRTARSLAEKTQRSAARLLAIVDECDQLYPHLESSAHWKIDFFSLWNTLQAAKRGLEDPSELVYVLGGVNPSGMERGSLAGQPNPLFETQKLYLKPMNADDAGSLLRGIGETMGLRFEASAVAEAFRLVGGHPMLLRKLGSTVHHRETNRSAIININESSVRNAYLTNKRNFFDYVLWVLEHLKQVAPDEERLLRDIALGGTQALLDIWADNEYREVFAHHLEQYGLVRFEDGTPNLTLDIIREALRRPPVSALPEQKKALRDTIDSLEVAVRLRLSADISSTRTAMEAIESVIVAIPGDAKNRAMTREQLREIGELSGLDALLQSLNWGDYELLLRKFYDEIRWYGEKAEANSRLGRIKQTFTQAHLVRHNNDSELKKLISSVGFEQIISTWRSVVDMFTG